MSAIQQLRSVVRRLDSELAVSLQDAADREILERARHIATLALEMAGGSPDVLEPKRPPEWELDTMTETEIDLAFVLGSLERALHTPHRVEQLVRDARERLLAVEVRLLRPRLG